MNTYIIEREDGSIETVEADSPKEAALIAAGRSNEGEFEVWEMDSSDSGSLYEVYQHGELVDSYAVR